MIAYVHTINRGNCSEEIGLGSHSTKGFETSIESEVCKLLLMGIGQLRGIDLSLHDRLQRKNEIRCFPKRKPRIILKSRSSSWRTAE